MAGKALTKICCRDNCEFSGQEQSLDNFPKDARRPDGKKSHCKSCNNIEAIDYYHKIGRKRFVVRYHSDEEYRKILLKRSSNWLQKKYHLDKEWRNSKLLKVKIRNKERYNTDPVFKEKCINASKEQRKRLMEWGI